MTKRIVCITGMDGTGKSTLISGLKKHLDSCYVTTIWDLMTCPVKGLPFKSKQEIDHFLCELTPDSRLLFLAHAMKYAIDKALLSSGNNILIDSYYYKYFASELALGANEALTWELAEIFPEPHHVIELILPVEESVTRKSNFSRYECGLNENPGEASFIKFQEKIMGVWPYFRTDRWHRVDAGYSAERVLAETLKHIQ